MNATRDPKPWLPAVPVHPDPMVMAWSNLERQRIEEYGRECFASGSASVKPFDPEALIRAVLPGGHSCDPQAVADDIREWARVHAASPAQPWQAEAHRLREALEMAETFIGEHPHGDNCFVSNHYAGDPGNRCNCGKDGALSYIADVLAESATTGKDAA